MASGWSRGFMGEGTGLPGLPSAKMTHKGWHCFGKAPLLITGWLWHPTHTLEWPWPLPWSLILRREEVVPIPPPHCSLSPSSVIKSKAVILGRGPVFSPHTQFLLAPSFVEISHCFWQQILWQKVCTVNQSLHRVRKIGLLLTVTFFGLFALKTGSYKQRKLLERLRLWLKT